MSSDAVLSQLNEVFRDVFDDGELTVTPQTTARDVDGWNSLANIRLMIAVEDAFRIKFDVGEFQEYRNVGDLVAGVTRRVG
jgi:acyl carrier protein